MVEKITYIAYDGTEFDNSHDCSMYEFNLCRGSLLKDIIVIDAKGNKISNDLFDEGVYNDFYKIIIPSNYDDEIIKSTMKFIIDYTGFFLYENITSKGTWVFKEPDRLILEEDTYND